MFWLLGIALLAVMLAALSAATDIGVPESVWLGTIAPSVLPIIGIAIALIMMILQYRKPLSVCRADKSQRLLVLGQKIVQIGLAILLIVISILQVIHHHQSAQQRQITQSHRVQALVRIEALSDSVMTEDTGYRQAAVIEAMLPMTKKLSSTELNQLAKHALDDNSLWQANSLAEPKRVLLQAYPQPNQPVKSSKPTSKFLSNLQKKRQNDGDNLAEKLNALMPNERRLMTLTIKPLEQSNEATSGFDSYRWLRSRHIDGTAQIQAVSELTITNWQPSTDEGFLQQFRQTINQGRFKLREHFYQGWDTFSKEQQQARAVTLSLLTGDRSLIHRDTKELYQIAGISHLLAISGAHVLFLALILAAMVSKLIERFWTQGYQRLSRWQWRFLVMVAAAFLYALFTGFDVPAARTAWTLLLVGLVRLTLLPISTRQVLLALAVVMAWFDPLMLWQAGYWLSFIAVALLLAYEEKRAKIQSGDTIYSAWRNRTWQAFISLFKLQGWLFLALLPVTLILFNKVSLWGLVVNLFAIGLFGWLLVPLNLLAGVVYLVSPAAADQIWQLITQMLIQLHQLIAWLTELGGAKQAWLTTAMTPSLLLITVLLLLPWLLPRGLIGRYLAIPPLFLLIMTVSAQNQALLSTPTLYVLPTGDTLISAALLQYPVVSKDDSTRQISWLILADHRAIDNKSWQSRPSQLSAEVLSATLTDNLQRLNISRLDGLVVQSAAAHVELSAQSSLPLLPAVAAKLSEQLIIHNYWQAGMINDLPKGAITAQGCQSGKVWQADGSVSLTDSPIRIEALTGWLEINDSRVWDCSIQISSQAAIEIVYFNLANPKTSPKAALQMRNSSATNRQAKAYQLILDGSRHPYHWQLWELLCPNQAHYEGKSVWVGHSRSQTSSETLNKLAIGSAVTYDRKPFEAALTMLPP